jgi:tetratricopeptide (TPR) repeat protein
MLGRLLFFTGDHAEADRYLRISEEASSPDDVATETVWRGTRARWLVAAGSGREAEELADSAVAILNSTDYVRLQGDALVDRAAVLSALGRDDAAMGDLREAGVLFERKGITSSLAVARRSYKWSPS